MERTSRGEIEVQRALDAVRSVAQMFGSRGSLPSIRDYLNAAFSTAHNQSTLRRFLAFLGAKADHRLDSLLPSDISLFLSEQHRRVSLVTVRFYRDRLRCILARAVKDRLLSANPVSLADMPKGEPPHRRRRAFTLEQLQHLIAECPPPWPAMIQLCFLTGGQRMGDIALLHWDQVDFSKNIITFSTRKVAREMVIPFSPRLRELLYALRNDTEYVLPDAAARYMRSQARFSADFTRHVRRLGLVSAMDKPVGDRRCLTPLSFHSIRHSVVTLLRASNAFSADITRAIVGHASEAIEREYFHAPDEHKTSGYNYLSDALSSISLPDSRCI